MAANKKLSKRAIKWARMTSLEFGADLKRFDGWKQVEEMR